MFSHLNIRKLDRQSRASRRRTFRVSLAVETLEDRCMLNGEGLGASDQVHFAPMPGSVGKASPLPKLDMALQATFQEWNSHREDNGQSLFAPSHSLVQVAQGQVTINAAAADNTGSLLADLESLGLQHGTSFGLMVSGRLPIDALDDAAQLGSLQFVSAALRPLTNVGNTTSQGDFAMNADSARATFGVDGSGVTVGVLSDSFDTGSTGSYAADVASGDLPAGINVLDDFGGGTDEGRGMMQLIYDVAPGVDMAFHTAYNGMPDFASGITELAAAGADVIIDDVIYFGEPMFQDGIIAQAVDTVVAGGVSYFSSAGNGSRHSYESPFVDSGVSITVGNDERGIAHDFDPGPGVDYLQAISVPWLVGGFVMSFQWDDPFYSVSGGAGAASDLDVYIINEAGTAIVAESITRNIGGDATEVFQFVNNGDLFAQFNIMILNFAGPAPSLIKYIWYDTGLAATGINEYGTASSTVFGHANAAGAQAVGAAYYGDTPAYGTDPALLESFSSAGGTPIVFDTAGNRLPAPVIRLKPEIVAPDGTNTTFFPAGNDTDGDGYPNFYGTSAAAPHAGAVAALMLEASPALSPAEIYTALQSTALDMGPVGFDYDTGYGLIQADLALGAIDGVPRLSVSLTDGSISENGGSTTGTVTRWGVETSSLLEVALLSDDTGEATVPATVTILAGQSSVSFPIAAVDDNLSDSTQTVLITATAGGLVDGTSTLLVADDEPEIVSQWASTIVDFSSEWVDAFNPIPNAWGSVQALGQPDTAAYGDYESAWAASSPDGTGVEYLLLGYNTPVLAYEARVRENYGNGFVTQIDVREASNGTLHTVWSGTDPSLPGSLVDFVAAWPITTYLVDAVKVTINSSHNSDINGAGEGWEGIDAVELLGWTAAPLASLGDLVWADLDNNGVQDFGEPGVADVTVNLLDGSGAFLETTTTDTAGLYTFTNLADGDYIVEVVKPASFDAFSSQDTGGDDAADSDVDSSGRTGVISLVAGQNDMSWWDAGLVNNGIVVTNDRALSETTTSGTLTFGTYLDTYTANDVYEEITEQHNGGKPQNRRSFLEHEWTFNVTGGDSVVFFVQASRTSNGEGDDFQFAYSDDGGSSYTVMSLPVPVPIPTEDNDTYVQFVLPNTLQGTVLVRVTDTDATPGNNNLDTLFVDDMFIRSAGPSGPDPPPTLPTVTITATDDTAAELGLDPGMFTVTRTDTSGELIVNYTVGGSADTADYVGDLGSFVTIQDGSSTATIIVTPVDDEDPEGSETVTLTLSPDAAYTIDPSDEATVTIADDDGGGDPTNIYADSEVTVSGIVTSGDLTATFASDDIYEVIQERESGGKPANRRSFLEHKWTFNVGVGGAVTFSVEAFHTFSTESEHFVFAYSTDDVTYNGIVTVIKESDDDTLQTVTLPDAPSGTVYVRVMDTDQTKGNRSLDSIIIDQMFFSVENATSGSATLVAAEPLADPKFFVGSTVTDTAQQAATDLGLLSPALGSGHDSSTPAQSATDSVVSEYAIWEITGAIEKTLDNGPNDTDTSTGASDELFAELSLSNLLAINLFE